MVKNRKKDAVAAVRRRETVRGVILGAQQKRSSTRL
jgi:hypothetical protein